LSHTLRLPTDVLEIVEDVLETAGFEIDYFPRNSEGGVATNERKMTEEEKLTLVRKLGEIYFVLDAND
jgi:hypothetical protein